MRKEIGAILIGFLSTILAWILPVLFPKLEAETGYKILAGVIVVGIMATVWVILPAPKKLKDEKIMSGDDNSIRIGSITGNQNRVGHEIHHHRPAQRHLTPQLSQGVEERITRDRPISISYPAGNHEAQVLANELHTHLKAQGYEMAGDDAGWFSGSTPPPNMVNITTMNDGERDVWHVYLGPAA